ncbi:methanol oxidation system protein MoxJ [Nitrospirillum pindoramense]|uniref:Amino acid ABC transporter substrate-binding protein (PAAT family) n=1 Tax=Nitrospirillum amazonense TaxID=28077 RepID=A0A560H060_9PROT|nr:methanol oxidation system protein MoxJ [Nitrospirillum amazonense]TWB39030.1 amino acid ABC transporter substrate-binding protein (PAAT family) [Nitrospirillum amazonense]
MSKSVTVRSLTARALLAAGVLLAPVVAEAGAGPAVAPEAPQPALRICVSAEEPPYSASDGSGFENKIAAAVAQAMGRQPVFVYADKPAIYLVRDWLDKKKCDVVVGLDASDPRVLTTTPYYRTGYVFVTRQDKHLDIQSWNDPAIRKVGHIVVEFGSPSEAMLKQVDRYNDNMSYLYSLVGFRSPRNEYVQIAPERMAGEVRNGGADLAVAFAPSIARYVKADPALRMTPVKDDASRSDGQKLPQTYDQSMGVRQGDTELLAALNAALVKARPQIAAVLAEEGIPLVEVAN